jgi:hypothetical protein
MRTQLAVVISDLGLVLAGTTVSVSAHHAFAAEFDSKKPVTFTGTVKKVEWVNPSRSNRRLSHRLRAFGVFGLPLNGDVHLPICAPCDAV